MYVHIYWHILEVATDVCVYLLADPALSRNDVFVYLPADPGGSQGCMRISTDRSRR